MNAREMLASAVADGLFRALDEQKQVAQGAIEKLDEVGDELHQVAGALAAHVASRPAVERVAMEKLTANDNPATGKPWTKTDAMANLDLAPEFASWRITRNDYEGQFHFLERKFVVQQRRVDLAIAMIAVIGKEV